MYCFMVCRCSLSYSLLMFTANMDSFWFSSAVSLKWKPINCLFLHHSFEYELLRSLLFWSGVSGHNMVLQLCHGYWGSWGIFWKVEAWASSPWSSKCACHLGKWADGRRGISFWFTAVDLCSTIFIFLWASTFFYCLGLFILVIRTCQWATEFWVLLALCNSPIQFICIRCCRQAIILSEIKSTAVW